MAAERVLIEVEVTSAGATTIDVVMALADLLDDYAREGDHWTLPVVGGDDVLISAVAIPGGQRSERCYPGGGDS